MNQRFHSLVIDDEEYVRTLVGEILCDEGWEVAKADSAETAFEMLTDQAWATVFCDVMLGGADGYAVLRRFKEQLPGVKVILMTGYGSASGALEAMACGAYDYLLKPFRIDELRLISQSLKEELAKEFAHGLPTADDVSHQSDLDLVGHSAAFIEVVKQVGRVAPTNLPVFLTGESGTGKEVVASALHRRSCRAGKPFIAVNCGAIPAELIESELFGHTKGSFTGAERDRRGLWEEADGGTVLLDEITETTPAFQVKLLRALQEGEIRRVGSNQTQRVDVRVLAASNRDVEREVEAGRFRKDLFYRLNAVSITLPPLRERREDILPLVRRFAGRVSPLNTGARFSEDALELIERYPWPGNIRELENAVVRAVAMCDGWIRVQDLPEHIRKYRGREAIECDLQSSSTTCQEPAQWPLLADVEGDYVARVLRRTRGNLPAASRMLGVDRKTVDRMIKRHGIDLSKVS